MISVNNIFDPSVFFNEFWNEKVFLKNLLKSFPIDYNLDLNFVLDILNRQKDIYSKGYIRETSTDLENEKQFLIKNKRQLEASLKTSKSLVFNHFHNFLPDNHFLNILLKQIAVLIGCKQYQIAFFYSPKNSQSFLPHIDNNDFFTLQLSGEKKWVTYGVDPFYKRGAEVSNKVINEYNLKQYDFFYIPRNTIHKVSSNEKASFSVSFIYRTDTQIDLILNSLRVLLYNEKLDNNFYSSFNPYKSNYNIKHKALKEIFNKF